MADRPTLADLAANPALTAEVDLDHIPELLGEMERCPPGSDEPAGVHSWKHAGVAQSASASDL